MPNSSVLKIEPSQSPDDFETRAAAVTFTPKELKDIRNILGAQDVKTHNIDDWSKSNYNYITTEIEAPKRSDVLTHELGHASGLLGKSKSKYFKVPVAATMNMLGLSLAPLINGYYGFRKGYDDALGKSISKPIKYLHHASQIANAAVLAEEAQASIRAMRAVYKVQGADGLKRAARVLLPAFGTYITGAILAQIAVPWISKKLGYWYGKNKVPWWKKL